MKMTVALIHPEHRAAVLESINTLDVCVTSLSQVSDGGTSVVSGTYRGVDARTHWPRLRLEVDNNDELPVVAAACRDGGARTQGARLRLEFAANETQIDPVVNAIASSAGPDELTHLGICPVFVVPFEEWFRSPPSKTTPRVEDNDPVVASQQRTWFSHDQRDCDGPATGRFARGVGHFAMWLIRVTTRSVT